MAATRKLQGKINHLLSYNLRSFWPFKRTSVMEPSAQGENVFLKVLRMESFFQTLHDWFSCDWRDSRSQLDDLPFDKRMSFFAPLNLSSKSGKYLRIFSLSAKLKTFLPNFLNNFKCLTFFSSSGNWPLPQKSRWRRRQIWWDLAKSASCFQQQSKRKIWGGPQERD